MNSTLKTIIFWLVILVSAMLLWHITRTSPSDRSTPEITYSQFMDDVDAGKVASVNISGGRIRGMYKGGQSFTLAGPENAAVYLEHLRSKGVEIRFHEQSGGSAGLIGTWAPLLLLGGLWFYMIRQMQRRNRIPPSGMPPGSGTIGTTVGP